MEIQRKSPLQLETQLESFASIYPSIRGRRDMQAYMLRFLHIFADDTGEENPLRDMFPRYQEIHGRFFPDYAAFLRDRTNRDRLALRLQSKERFDDFRETIAAIREAKQNRTPVPYKRIGEASNPRMAEVYLVEHEGKSYAVKLFDLPPHPEENIPRISFIAENVEALIRARSISEIPALIAHSFEKQAIVMEYVEGESMKEHPGIFTEHDLEKLLTLAATMWHLGISIDPAPGNVMKDPQGNIHVIDPNIRFRSLAEQLGSIITYLPRFFPTFLTNSLSAQAIAETFRKTATQLCNPTGEEKEQWEELFDAASIFG